MIYLIYVTLGHKTSQPVFEIEMYTSSESGINQLSIDVWFVKMQYFAETKLLKIWNLWEKKI